MGSRPASESSPGTLDAVNEELEKAIEQMRVSNAALLATRQGLHSLTALLDTMQQEVEMLSHELKRLKDSYAHTLDHVPYPVLLSDGTGRVEFWNRAAERIFKLADEIHAGVDLSQIPVQPSLRQILTRKHRAVAESGGTVVLSNQVVQVTAALYRMDVHLTSLSAGILVVFRDTIAGLKEQEKMKLIGSFAS